MLSALAQTTRCPIKAALERGHASLIFTLQRRDGDGRNGNRWFSSSSICLQSAEVQGRRMRRSVIGVDAVKKMDLHVDIVVIHHFHGCNHHRRRHHHHHHHHHHHQHHHHRHHHQQQQQQHHHLHRQNFKRFCFNKLPANRFGLKVILNAINNKNKQFTIIT